ncbi:MFS transporter [Nonomuraea rubra]|uniref:MFS transporter n=1 Tax=Nonomuraea rubra TaxID=46180 RepID=UPI0033DABD3B
MRRPAQVVISATVFVDLLGFTVILPGLPFFATGLGAGGAAFGLVMSAYSVAQFICAPLLGRLSDRYGRRRLVLLALAGAALSLALTGAADSLAWLVACRVLAGACGGSISVAYAYVADAVPPERRTGAMAGLGAAIGLAFVIGPALGSLLAPWGFAASAYAAAGLAAVNLVAAWRWLPEPGRPQPGRPQPGRPQPGRPQPGRPQPGRPQPGRAPAAASDPDRQDLDSSAPDSGREFGSGAPGSGRMRRSRAMVRIGRLPAVVPLAATRLLAMAAFVGMETTLALLGGTRYGWDTATVGLVLAAAGLSMAVVQSGPVGWAAGRWGEARVAAAGAVLMAACLPVIPLAPGWWPVAAVCLLSAGHGMLTSTVASLMAGAGPAGRRGARLGVGESAAAGGRIFGPLLAGLLFDLGVVLPYLAGAAMAGLALAAVLVAALALPAVRDPVEESA